MSIKIKINENFGLIKPSYLFSDIAKRVKAYSAENPDAEIIRLGIGDVTRPLMPCVTEAMKNAVAEMEDVKTFRGYPPEYGYDFLKDAIMRHYAENGVTLEESEIFVSDGAKSDIGNITDLFGDADILIPDPVYPVYLDSNLMDGRKLTFIRGSKENSFLPTPENVEKKPYVIYLCSPNNPTGAAYDKSGLKKWVDFALETGSLIVFDAAYEAFITDENIPHSIYQISGADECAVEICSFSKFAGFTGVRCGWTVFPENLRSGDSALGKMWARRQATKFNGVSYVTQRGAEAALSDIGIKECRQNIDYYRRNASLLGKCLEDNGVWFTGGIHSPYLWLECPGNEGSWEFFDRLLHKANLVGTPGEGFGDAGKGYFRLTSFGTYENTLKAVERLNDFFKKG